MRRIVVLPQPEGPSRETNSPLLKPRSTPLHHGVVAERLDQVLDAEEVVGHVGQSVLAAVLGAKRTSSWIMPIAPQVRTKEMIGERRGLVGAVGADVLHVDAEGRPVEQARDGELADDDGEGEEGAGQHRDDDVGEDHAGR